MARRSAREASAAARVLPDFLVIGAQKAGTTSLYAYLVAHPDICAAGRKEVHYFDLNHERGPGWYRSMFPLRAAARARALRTGRPQLTGEASPYYLFHPLAPERAAALVPDAKLVVLLRDPVERAWSHYRHEVRAGREPLSFADALDAEPERLAGTVEAIRAGAPPSVWENHRRYSYVARGRYAEQLRAWLAVFEREQLLVLRAEDLFAAPEQQWRRTLDFLGVRAEAAIDFAVHNSGESSSGGGSGVPADQRERLAEVFAEPNDELASWAGLGGISAGWTHPDRDAE
jgi:hypothetical protein